jgi:hypothetical protein
MITTSTSDAVRKFICRGDLDKQSRYLVALMHMEEALKLMKLVKDEFPATHYGLDYALGGAEEHIKYIKGMIRELDGKIKKSVESRVIMFPRAR